jgi:hypothetical protein
MGKKEAIQDIEMIGRIILNLFYMKGLRSRERASGLKAHEV